jgi:COP9 signalosome complex subunit 1
MGNLDLGKHFEKVGRLTEAAEAYSRMRQDVSSTKQVVECARHLADIAMRRRDWPTVLTNMAKITGNTDGDEDNSRIYSILLAAIASMNLGHYHDAARYMLRFNGELPASEYSHVASPNDIAIYGSLVGLATLERQELHDKVLHSSGFRVILDYEPHMRKAVNLFYNGRYSECLSKLETYRNDCLLDVHLQKHVPNLFSRIRNRCIIQYFSPFSCVTLDSLSSAFGTPNASVEDELVQMIRDGLLNARIDAKKKVSHHSTTFRPGLTFV